MSQRDWIKFNLFQTNVKIVYFKRDFKRHEKTKKVIIQTISHFYLVTLGQSVLISLKARLKYIFNEFFLQHCIQKMKGRKEELTGPLCPLKCCPTLLRYSTFNFSLTDVKRNAAGKLCVSAFNRKKIQLIFNCFQYSLILQLLCPNKKFPEFFYQFVCWLFNKH